MRARPQLADLHSFLSAQAQALGADAVIICTEPKAHKAFALWALELGLPVFMDKPITAFPDYDAVESLATDFDELVYARNRVGARVVISCERRMHHGYAYVEAFLRRFIAEHRVPITYINVHFGGGVWMMPWEFGLLENHPFKYGYGILLHSGYHYLDLLVRLAALNLVIEPIELDRPRVQVNATFPDEALDASSGDLCERLFPREDVRKHVRELDRVSWSRCGEADVSAIGFYSAGNRRSVNFSLQLIGTTVSARTDPFRSAGNRPTPGRMRQEDVRIHLGNLCSLAVHSNPFSPLTQTSIQDDFNITIATNPLVAKAAPLQRIDRSTLSRLYERLPLNARLNAVARQNMFRSFLTGHDAGSDIGSHAHSVALLLALFRQIRRDSAQ